MCSQLADLIHEQRRYDETRTAFINFHRAFRLTISEARIRHGTIAMGGAAELNTNTDGFSAFLPQPTQHTPSLSTAYYETVANAYVAMYRGFEWAAAQAQAFAETCIEHYPVWTCARVSMRYILAPCEYPRLSVSIPHNNDVNNTYD